CGIRAGKATSPALGPPPPSVSSPDRFLTHLRRKDTCNPLALAAEGGLTATDLWAHGRATVHLRERWLEFLLGAAPRIGAYGLADDPPQLLPPAFAEALRIDLGPRVSQRGEEFGQRRCPDHRRGGGSG
ncbi:MAG TPA: hypothetical protein VFK02_02965, partial [Kofleriaceae bacterium]|nr:hypothetical protein [Kofleriaceae bacterium]